MKYNKMVFSLKYTVVRNFFYHYRYPITSLMRAYLLVQVTKPKNDPPSPDYLYATTIHVYVKPNRFPIC